MAGVLWLISAAADHVWPEAKWHFVALFLAGWLFLLARQFVSGVNEYREATDAFLHRRIVPGELPPDFRSLSHEKTLQQVIDEFGQPSRKIELIAPSPAFERGVKFFAYEYALPYEAAVLVMPEPPSDRNCKIRAVYFRPRADDDEIFSQVRA
jgi:hypothetical protein